MISSFINRQKPFTNSYWTIINGSAREDSTRVGTGGNVKRQTVDDSPIRRINQSLYMMCMGAKIAVMRSSKSIAECLADEISNCTKSSSNSYAIKKKDYIERSAKSNR